MHEPGKSVELLVQRSNADVAFFDFVAFEHTWIFFGFLLATGLIRFGRLNLDAGLIETKVCEKAKG